LADEVVQCFRAEVPLVGNGIACLLGGHNRHTSVLGLF
jgi:hypothetical protein